MRIAAVEKLARRRLIERTAFGPGRARHEAGSLGAGLEHVRLSETPRTTHFVRYAVQVVEATGDHPRGCPQRPRRLDR